MGLRINTNVLSLSAQRTLGNTNNAQAQSIGKLSSGQRIVKASDDAAGLAISEKLKARIRGTSQAERNANDGISLIQTAEGGLNEVSNILIRLRELSVQSASDTVGNDERKFTDLEYQNLKTEIDRIAKTTEFNGKKLLSGGGDRYDFQIGTENRQGLDRISYDAADLDSSLISLFGGQEVAESQEELRLNLEEINNDDSYENEAEREAARIDAQKSYKSSIENDGTAESLALLNVATKGAAQDSLAKLDNALQKVSGKRAQLGSVQNRLGSVIQNLQVSKENLSAANSRIRDTDFAAETARNMKLSILSNAGSSVLSQANARGQSALKLIG